MKKILVGVILMGVVMASTSISYADGVIVPASIKVEAFKKQMKSKGMDLYGKDDSDGEIQNMGTQMKIITYKPVTINQLNLIGDVAKENARK